MTDKEIKIEAEKENNTINIKNIKYPTYEEQSNAIEDFLSGEYQIIDLRGGFRSGKSITGATAVLKGAINNSNSRWLVMAETYAEGKETTYRTLFERLPNCDHRTPEESPLVEEYNKTDKKLILVNGSEIILGSAKKSDRHKGDEFSGIWMDEVSFYNNLIDLMEMSLSRLSASKGPLSVIWTTTGHKPHQDYYFISEQRVNPNTGNEIKWDINMHTLHTDNNPFLSEEALENLKQTHQDNEEHGLRGGFKIAEGLVYSDFNRDKHVVNKFDLDLREGWRAYGYDSGWNDPRVLLEIGQTKKGQLVVLDEYYRSESTIEECINWFKNNNKKSGIIYSEIDKEHIFKMRKKLNIPVIKANKSLDEGIEEVQERFKEDEDGDVGILIEENCINIIQELVSYEEEDVGSVNAKDHALDCLRYVVNTDKRQNVPTNEEQEDNKENKTNNRNINIDQDYRKKKLEERKNIKNNIRNNKRNKRY